MRLLSAKITGYKSFGNPVEAAFQPGLNGVIGPDQCGKTSFIEAILWALGISGNNDAPDRLLFRGVESQAAADAMAVELRFAEPPSQTSDITVSRILARNSGRSEYRINGQEQGHALPSDYAELIEQVLWIPDHSTLKPLASSPPSGQILFLDELDSDLSAEEIQRYCEAVSRLRDTNQIILTSHRKTILTLAGKLIGVSMREFGISILIERNIPADRQ